ncbi:MAG: hypothetical protein ACE5FZ_07600 [Nitrospiria bacterium]
MRRLKLAHSSCSLPLVAVILVFALFGCGEISNPQKPDITAPNGQDGDKATVFVANAGDGTVIAFDPSRNAEGNILPLIPEGNISPTRRFPQTLVEPTGVFLDKATDTLYVADASGNAILIYEMASTIKPKIGSSVPTRIITGRDTRLDHPYDLAFDSVRNQLFVANRDGNSVLRFQVNCPNLSPPINPLDGNIAPCGVLKGIETQIFFPRGIAIDTTKNVLYISNVGDDSILIYDNADKIGGSPAVCFSVNHAPPVNASLCNRKPNRVISPHNDPNQLENILDIPFDIFIDEPNDRLYVVNTGFNLPGILIYDQIFTQKRTGSIVPDRTWISGNMALPPECAPLPNPSPGLPFPPQCNNSQLSLPVGVDVDVPNNLMYVVNNNNTNNINLGTSGNDDSTAVLVFDLDSKDSDGNPLCTDIVRICRNIPPIRRLGGDITPDANSLTNPVGVAVDPGRQVMYLTNPTAKNFMTFSLDGNINPFKINSGNSLSATNPATEQTFLEQPSSFFYDDVLDRLYITNFTAKSRSGVDGNKQITVFDQILGSVPIQLTGILSVQNGSTAITGAGTLFTNELKPGIIITIGKELATVATINSDTSLDLLAPFPGATNTAVAGSIVTGGRNFSNTAPSWSFRDTTNIESPRGVYLDKGRGFFLVLSADSAKSQLVIYPSPATPTSPTGTPISLPAPSHIFSGPGSGLTLGGPTSMTVDEGNGFVYVADKGNNNIIVYNYSLNPPVKVKTFTNSAINQPSGLFVNAGTLSDGTIRDTLYVTNAGDNSILAFDAVSTKTGTEPPDRTLSTTTLPAGDVNLIAAPLSPYVDGETDRLFFINAGTNSVFTYHNASTRNVNVLPDGANALPDQKIMKEGATTPDHTRLNFSSSNNTGALIYNGHGNTGTLFIGQPIGLPKDNACDPLPGGIIPFECPRGSLLLFGMEQKVAPSHIFSGGNTALKAPSAMAFDAQRDILYLADQGDSGSTAGGDDAISIITGASALDGNAASTSFVPAKIDGATPLNNPAGLFLDETSNKLYVANSGGTTALTGNLSVLVDSTVVAGTGTLFTAELSPGDTMTINNQSVTVAKIKDDTTLSLLSRWTAPTHLHDPTGIPGPRAFVSRCGAATPCNILVFDNADLLGQATPPSSASQTITNTAIDKPHGLTVGPTGMVYAANTGGDSVLIFNSDGTLKATLKGVLTQIGRPVDVALDPAHDFLYVLNRLDQEILVFAGVSAMTGTVNITPVRVISPFNKGVISSIESDTQFTWTAAYTGQTTTGETYGREGVTFSETFSNFFLSGTIAVTNNSTTVTGNGTKFLQELQVGDTVQVGTSLFTRPTGLYLDTANDLLYVTDQVANSVHIFNNASQAIGDAEHRTIAGDNTGLRQPSAITVNPKTP